MSELTCIKCNHKWTPTKPIDEVKICPKCKTKYWNTEKKTNDKPRVKRTSPSKPKPKPVSKPQPAPKITKTITKSSKQSFKLDIDKKYRGSGDDELEKLTNDLMNKR